MHKKPKETECMAEGVFENMRLACLLPKGHEGSHKHFVIDLKMYEWE